MLRQFEWTLGVLASVVAAAGLISLIQRLFSVEMATVLGQYIQYYRELMNGLFGWIPLPGWQIPLWYYDSLALNLVATGAYARSEILNKSNARIHPLLYAVETLTPFLAIIQLFITSPLLALAGKAWPKIGQHFSFREVGLAIALFGVSALATGAFFAVNQLLLD